MNNQTTWKYIFQLKAAINWVESVFLLLSDQWIRELLGEKPLVNSEYSHLFLALVFVIGIGYWWVGQDIDRASRHRQTWNYRAIFGFRCASLSHLRKQASPILFNSRCH